MEGALQPENDTFIGLDQAGSVMVAMFPYHLEDKMVGSIGRLSIYLVFDTRQ